MNKLTTSIVLVIFAAFCCNAQTLSVKSVVELTNDITARTQVRNDANGQACAMLRVNAPSMMVSFDQNIVGDVSVLPGEYIVYVPEATSTIQVKNQEESIDVDFSKFDINLEGKKCYRIILEKESNSKVTGVGKLAISANYDNAVVMVDGVPMGQVPLLLENVSPGRHTIAVPNTIGVTMKDITTYVKEGETTDLKLTLHKETRKPVEIESLVLAGGDMSTIGDPVIHTYGVNIVEKYGKKGVVDYMGNVLVPFKFDYISPVKVNGLYRVNTHDNIDGKLLTNFKWGLYKPGIGLVADLKYNNIYNNSLNPDYNPETIVSERSKYMPACRNGCWGFLDPNGKEITRSFRRYQYNGEPIDCDAPLLLENVVKVGYYHNYGLINYEGKIITELKYKYIEDFFEGVAQFERDGIQGLLDESGKEILILPSNLKFLPYSFMNDGLILVEDINTKKRGFINKNGALVIPCKYDYGYKFKHGLCSVEKEDSWMIIDRNDHIVCHDGDILEDIYGKVNGDKGITARLESPYIRKRRDDGKYDILLASGQLFIPSCTYDGKYDYYLMGDKSLYVILDDEHIYNKDGDKIFDFDGIDYDVIVKDGFIRIRNRSTRSYGFISEQGEILFNCIYGENDKPSSEAAPISEASDEESSEEEYNIDWDTSYETVITGYEGISEGLAVLSLGDRYGFIDNTGKVVVPLIYTAVTPFEDGVALVRDQNGKWSKITREELGLTPLSRVNNHSSKNDTPPNNSDDLFVDKTFTVNGVSFRMVAVKGGTFQMGATTEMEPSIDIEKPVHKVTLNDYYIGETEVTRALWNAVLNKSTMSGKDLPVADVTWEDCLRFIENLNTYTGQHFRLPTEAEWEFAARGGNNSKHYRYSGSNDIDEVAWYEGNSNNAVHLVAQKKCNELGLYDMSGNVMEWCLDNLLRYPNTPEFNPMAEPRTTMRVMRGGAYFRPSERCRISDRRANYKDQGGPLTGLRLCLPY